jgi:hypothetical protein
LKANSSIPLIIIAFALFSILWVLSAFRLQNRSLENNIPIIIDLRNTQDRFTDENEYLRPELRFIGTLADTVELKAYGSLDQNHLTMPPLPPPPASTDHSSGAKEYRHLLNEIARLPSKKDHEKNGLYDYYDQFDKYLVSHSDVTNSSDQDLTHIKLIVDTTQAVNAHENPGFALIVANTAKSTDSVKYDLNYSFGYQIKNSLGQWETLNIRLWPRVCFMKMESYTLPAQHIAILGIPKSVGDKEAEMRITYGENVSNSFYVRYPSYMLRE